MRILIGHNRYQERAGEDAVFDAEAALLRSKGHEVIRFEEDNLRVGQVNRFKLASGSIWSREAHRNLLQIIHDTSPDVCHFHNLLPLLSNSVLEAAHSSGITVVQTLHNYRALCPVATFYRDGHVCELCAPKPLQWPAARYACYRGSRSASAVIAAKHAVDKWRGTWKNGADVYIAMTAFMREIYIRYGFPADRVVVKPNFIEPDPGVGPGSGRTFLFAGRLAEEKGIGVLLEAWELVDEDAPLVIAGDGPLRGVVEEAARRRGNIDYVGSIPHAELIERMKNAAMLIFPSIWYEGFPRTIVEAFSVGLPVLAFRIGGIASIVEHERSGILADPGQPDGIRHAVDRFRRSDELRDRLWRGARKAYEEKYTAEANYQQLMQIYSTALQRDRGNGIG